MTNSPRPRVLTLMIGLLAGLVTLGTATPAGALSCAALPNDFLESVARAEPPYASEGFENTAVVGRVVDRSPDPGGPIADGTWLGAVDVVYAIGRDSVPAMMDVSAGEGASEWGVGLLPSIGDLVAIYEWWPTEAAAPTELFLGICPNSESLTEDRAESARLLATDLGTLIVEPDEVGPTTTTTPTTEPTTTTEPPTTTESPATTTTEPPATSEAPTTTDDPAPTTTSPPMPVTDVVDDESSSTWLVVVGLAVAIVAAGVVLALRRR